MNWKWVRWHSKVSSSINVLDYTIAISFFKKIEQPLPHVLVMVPALVVKIGRLKMTRSIKLDQMINNLSFEARSGSFLFFRMYRPNNIFPLKKTFNFKFSLLLRWYYIPNGKCYQLFSGPCYAVKVIYRLNVLVFCKK